MGFINFWDKTFFVVLNNVWVKNLWGLTFWGVIDLKVINFEGPLLFWG